MKISHLLFMGLVAATAVSCSNDDIEGTPTNGAADGAKTRLSIGAVVRSSTETRAPNTFERDYNYIKEYVGKDNIGNLDVFLGSDNASEGVNGILFKNFNAAAGGSYAIAGARVFPNAQDANAIEVLEGAKKQVNVMLNANLTEEGANLAQWVRDAGSAAGLTDRWFDKPYDLVGMDLGYTGTYGAEPKTAVSKVAKYTNGKDEILMTSEDFVSYNVNNNITAPQTVAAGAEAGATADAGAPSAQNRFVRDIRRAASRVYVTAAKDATAEAFEIKNGTTVLGTVTSLQYVVGQGERKFYVGQKRVNEATGNRAATYAASKADEVRTPGYAYVPTAGTYDASAADSGAIKHYDYATLWKGADNGSADRNTAAQLSDGVKVGARTAASFNDLADEMLDGTFFLPATHKKGANGTDSQFKKGNSTYVLVRGTFKPTRFSDDGMEVYLTTKTNVAPYYQYATGTTTVGAGVQTAGDDAGTFYYTSKGEFFRTLEGAVKSFDATSSTGSAATRTEYKHGGETYIIPTGHYIKRFPAGKMLWTLWANPSSPVAENQYWNAPTVRNNIYAIHITGITQMGTNWNPLVPKPWKEDPTKPGVNVWDDYTNKFNPDPNPNTDPRVGGEPNKPNVPEDPTKPEDPDDPKQPPLNPDDPDEPNKPEDPLPTPKTYMSVEAGILPWQVHGYEVQL